MHVDIATGFQHQSGNEVHDRQFLKEDLDMASEAEGLGFESIWVTEHHFSNSSISPSPLQSLAYLAGRTRQVKLGTQVVVLPWNDPVRVAEQALWLDNVTEGRLLLGFGRGLGKMEYDGLRVDINQTRQLYREHAELIITALETGVIEGGEFTKQPRRELRPRPFRSFEGRVFGSAGSPESVRTVAELGMGVMIITSLLTAPPRSEKTAGIIWSAKYAALPADDTDYVFCGLGAVPINPNAITLYQQSMVLYSSRSGQLVAVPAAGAWRCEEARSNECALDSSSDRLFS